MSWSLKNKFSTSAGGILFWNSFSKLIFPLIDDLLFLYSMNHSTILFRVLQWKCKTSSTPFFSCFPSDFCFHFTAVFFFQTPPFLLVGGSENLKTSFSPKKNHFLENSPMKDVVFKMVQKPNLNISLLEHWPPAVYFRLSVGSYSIVFISSLGRTPSIVASLT